MHTPAQQRQAAHIVAIAQGVTCPACGSGPQDIDSACERAVRDPEESST